MSHNVPQCPVSDDRIDAPAPDPSDLSDLQLAAIDLLLTGATCTAVAAALAIDRRTLYRWRTHDDAFRATLDQRRRELCDQAADRFRATLTSALDVLQRHLADPYAPTSFRAARATLALANISKLLVPQTPDL